MLNVANRMGRRYDHHGQRAAAAHEPLREALKRSAAALKADGVPFALGGGYALWVHGAPEPNTTSIWSSPRRRCEDAVRSLGAAGFRIERPPEDWLFKAYLRRRRGHG